MKTIINDNRYCDDCWNKTVVELVSTNSFPRIKIHLCNKHRLELLYKLATLNDE